LYVPAGTETAAERSAEIALQTREFSNVAVGGSGDQAHADRATPEEESAKHPVTNGPNVRMERFAEGEGGVARSASERRGVTPTEEAVARVLGRPLHAHTKTLAKKRANQIRSDSLSIQKQP